RRLDNRQKYRKNSLAEPREGAADRQKGLSDRKEGPADRQKVLLGRKVGSAGRQKVFYCQNGIKYALLCQNDSPFNYELRITTEDF
ncbi:MAG: hypothetical protein LBS12_07725, partial [Prevotellaceae bacterium]|nr:hypothetical protein [Prevotellaceae bacterium]